MLLALVGGLAAGSLIALVLGLRWWWGLAMFAAVIGVAHREDIRWMLNHLKGARGEEAVGRILESLEPRGFRAIHDLDTGRGNVDHVVVGPTGVFAVETKAWTGRMYLAKGGRLMVSGFDRDRAVKQAVAEAMEVRRRLRDAGIGGYVGAVIVLTATRLPKGPMELANASVIEMADLERFLLDRPVCMDAFAVSRAIGAVYRNGGRITARNVTQDA